MKKFDVTFFDYCMLDERARTKICQILFSDEKIKKTVLLDISTYLDKTDLSFDIDTYIVTDTKNQYFIIGAGIEDKNIFIYFIKKIEKQIYKFNPKGQIISMYIDLN